MPKIKTKMSNAQKNKASEFKKITEASRESNIPGTINNRLKSKDWKERRIAQKILSDKQHERKTGNFIANSSTRKKRR